MKSCLLIIFLCASLVANSQTRINPVMLHNLKGEPVNISEFSNGDKPLVVLFWATWCNPCLEELENISDLLPEWKEEYDFNLVAISVDDSRSSAKVNSFVVGRQWDFDILLDPNQDAKRAFNITEIPHYIIFDASGKIVKGHSGYFPGDEDILFEEIKLASDDKK